MTNSYAVADPDPKNIVITLLDRDGNSVVAMLPVTVSQPTGVTITGDVEGPTTPQLITDGVTIAATFDGNPSGSFTATVAWGDGVSSSDGVIVDAASGTVEATHLYAEPGVYEVSVTVTDDGSGASDTKGYRFVVVYDPTAGSVSGSGFYWSGAEARPLGPRWGTAAFFGYDARYKRNATVPSGTTKLRLLGDFYFKSTSYDYLIVNAAMAVAEGVGKIGDKEYRFRVQGVDGGRTDFFQISIWDPTEYRPDRSGGQRAVLRQSRVVRGCEPGRRGVARWHQGEGPMTRWHAPIALAIGAVFLVVGCSSGGESESTGSTAAPGTTGSVVDGEVESGAQGTETTQPELQDLAEEGIQNLPEGRAPEVLGPIGKTDIEYETEDGVVQIGVAEVPEEVSSSFPLPPDLDVQISSTSGSDAGFSGVSELSFDDLVEFFNTELPLAGYTISEDQLVAGVVAVYEFDGPDGNGQIAIRRLPAVGAAFSSRSRADEELGVEQRWRSLHAEPAEDLGRLGSPSRCLGRVRLDLQERTKCERQLVARGRAQLQR